MHPARGTPIGLESKIVRRHPRTADMAGSCEAYALFATAPNEAIDMRAYRSLPARTGGPCDEAVPISGSRGRPLLRRPRWALLGADAPLAGTKGPRPRLLLIR